MASRYAAVLLLLYCGIFNIRLTLQTTIQEANRLFATDLLKELVSEHSQENVIVSPYFIQRSLALAMLAAREPLKSEIKNTIHLEKVDEEQDNYLRYFKKSFKTYQNTQQMFYDSNLQLRKMFLLTAEKSFGLKPLSMNGTTTQQNTKFINKIVEKELKLFRDMLGAEFLRDEDALIFLSAVLFKNQWDLPFEMEGKRMGKFREFDKTEVDILSLYGIRKVGYADLSNYNVTAIQLPFKNQTSKLLILMPSLGAEDIDWSRLDDIGDILDNLQMESVAVSLPSFNVQTHIDLSIALTKLGLGKFFGPKADFADAFQKFPDNGEVGFVHAAQLEVSEFGSNVKIDTQSSMLNTPGTSTWLAPKKFYVLDRPFAFVLHSSDAVYMVGRIVAPNNPPDSDVRIVERVETNTDGNVERTEEEAEMEVEETTTKTPKKKTTKAQKVTTTEKSLRFSLFRGAAGKGTARVSEESEPAMV